MKLFLFCCKSHMTKGMSSVESFLDNAAFKVCPKSTFWRTVILVLLSKKPLLLYFQSISTFLSLLSTSVPISSIYPPSISISIYLTWTNTILDEKFEQLEPLHFLKEGRRKITWDLLQIENGVGYLTKKVFLTYSMKISFSKVWNAGNRNGKVSLLGVILPLFLVWSCFTWYKIQGDQSKLYFFPN